MRWASLWKGPEIMDEVECPARFGGGICVGSTWMSMGLYALDTEGRPWTLCRRTMGPGTRWYLVDDLVSGAAGRQWLAEQEPK